jgi:hypothetical protein
MPVSSNQEIEKLLGKITSDLGRLRSLLGVGGGVGGSVSKSSSPSRVASPTPKDEVPGIEGVFDGTFMVAADGQKHEVTAAYAAKSQLVYGDILKMITREDGSKFFKHIKKAPKKKVAGIVSKKEGDWYVLTEHGSHKLSSSAVEFMEVKVNDEVSVYLPEEKLNAPFAALHIPRKRKSSGKAASVTKSTSSPASGSSPVVSAPVSAPVSANPVATPVPVKPVETSVSAKAPKPPTASRTVAVKEKTEEKKPQDIPDLTVSSKGTVDLGRVGEKVAEPAVPKEPMELPELAPPAPAVPAPREVAVPVPVVSAPVAAPVSPAAAAATPPVPAAAPTMPLETPPASLPREYNVDDNDDLV